MLEPFRDEVVLRLICDMQGDSLVLQVVSNNAWFSLVAGFCGCQLKMMVTFYYTREKICFSTMYIRKFMDFIFIF